jgi:hypothetical protein
MDRRHVYLDMDGLMFPYLRDSALLEERAEKLLAGDTPESEAPDGVPELAELLAALRAPAHPLELAGEAAVIGVFTAEVGASRVAKEKDRADDGPARVRRLPTRAIPKVAAATVAGVLAFGGVAAAAVTGSLPGGLQSLAHDRFGAPAAAVTAAGVSTAVARPSAESPQPTASEGSAHASEPAAPSARPSIKPGVGPNASGPSASGLCHAFAGAKGSSTNTSGDPAARQLTAAAAGAGETVEQFCAPYLTWGKDTHASHGRPAVNGHQDQASHSGGSQGQGGSSQDQGGGSQGQGHGSDHSTPNPNATHGSHS